MNEIAITKPYVLRHTQKGGRQVWGMGRGRGAEGREGERERGVPGATFSGPTLPARVERARTTTNIIHSLWD